MAVIVNQNSNAYAIPEEGQYLGVVADVIDLGPVTTQFGTKEKVQIVWLLDAYDEDGNQFRVSAFYNKSLHEKASLTRDIKKIAGVTPSGQFDVESLLGLNSSLVIEHNESDGKTYANITAILKAPKGKILQIPDDFERKIERDGTGSSENPVNTSAKPKQAKPTFKQAPAPARQAAPAPVQTRTASGGGSTITRRPAAAVAAQEPQYDPQNAGPVTDEDIPF
jgi:hypothetical protein